MTNEELAKQLHAAFWSDTAPVARPPFELDTRHADWLRTAQFILDLGTFTQVHSEDVEIYTETELQFLMTGNSISDLNK